MISNLKRIQARKSVEGEDGGFTLIELLIVIVVLGILAAVVVFSLGSVTSKSAVSACQADGATVNTSMAAYQANNGGAATSAAALTGTASGGPYLQSFPSNTSHYQFAVGSDGNLYVAKATTNGGPAAATANTITPPVTGWNVWAGASSCVGVAS